MVKYDDDGSQVNGELTDQNDVDNTASETNSLQLTQFDNDLQSKTAVNENNLELQRDRLPAIRVDQHVFADDDTNSDEVHGGKGPQDDIYNFELSEDQKQAIQELLNLKLDLGFTAGLKIQRVIALPVAKCSHEFCSLCLCMAIDKSVEYYMIYVSKQMNMSSNIYLLPFCV